VTQIESFCGSELQKQLAEAKLSFPLIVKPQVACGVADAHNMALIFKIEEFSNLSVPLPAILQVRFCIFLQMMITWN
jgi:hypothetical protein